MSLRRCITTVGLFALTCGVVQACAGSNGSSSTGADAGAPREATGLHQAEVDAGVGDHGRTAVDVGVGMHDGGLPGDAGLPSGDPDTFYALLALTTVDYALLDEAELVEASDFIGVGRFKQVREGLEVVRLTADPPLSIHTLVLELEVGRAWKGQTFEGSVYVEHVHGGAFELETYRQHLSSEPVLLFLSPATWRESDKVEYLDQGAGYPSGAVLYRPTTPQGWFVERDGQLEQPFADQHELFANATSFEDVEREIAGGSFGDAGTEP